MKAFFVILILFKVPVFAQKVTFFAHINGPCVTTCEAFYNRGFKIKTCSEIESWFKEFNVMVEGECSRVLVHAIVEGQGNTQALGVVIEHCDKLGLNCKDQTSSSLSNNSNTVNNYSPNTSNQDLASNYYILEALKKSEEREKQKQSLIIDYKGPNKYSFLNEGDVDLPEKRDLIYLKTGAKIDALIINIDDGKISYKKASIPNGPTFVIKRSDVSKVLLQNGQTLEFSK